MQTVRVVKPFSYDDRTWRKGWLLQVPPVVAERLIAAGLAEHPTPMHDSEKGDSRTAPERGKHAYQTCTVSGCPNLTPGGRCDTHAKEARARRAQRRKSVGHDDPRWREKSRAYLRTNPWCDSGEHGPLSYVRASVVDHIDGLGPNGPNGFTDSNLQSLCVSCHNSKTGQEHGFGNG